MLGRLSAFDHVQRRQDLRHDLARLRLDRDDDGIFVRSRFLQRFELAVKQASRHEMLMAGGDTACDQRLVTLEIDQTDVCTITDQNIAVAALQRGARDDAMSARTTRLVDPGGDRIQPGPTILIGERNTAVHLVDVGGRMKPIGVLELPSQMQCEERADGRLPASRNAHDDHHLGAGGEVSSVGGICTDINSPLLAPRRDP